MSIKAMVYVWGTPLRGSQKLMLLAIADRCDDEGVCFPGVPVLAKKCSITVRAAQDMITALEKAGEIAVAVGQGTKTTHGPTNLYYMKRYREVVGLSTPTLNTRIIQITPSEDGMKKTASLTDGVKDSASQGMKKTASDGMKDSAFNTSVDPSVDPLALEETTLRPAFADRASAHSHNRQDASQVSGDWPEGIEVTYDLKKPARAEKRPTPAQTPSPSLKPKMGAKSIEEQQPLPPIAAAPPLPTCERARAGRQRREDDRGGSDVRGQEDTQAL